MLHLHVLFITEPTSRRIVRRGVPKRINLHSNEQSVAPAWSVDGCLRRR